MAHINHFRLLNSIKKRSIQEAIPMMPSYDSFAAFGGVKTQRDLIGLYEISRNIGSKGIVLVHNDPDFEASLSQIMSINPYPFQTVNPPKMYLTNSQGRNNSFYDPLYGLDKSEVLDAILPNNPDNRYIAEAQSIRSVLADYLDIIACQFRNDFRFGRYPYNLEVLYELTAMPYSQLDQQVLTHLPEQFRYIASRLSAPDAQQKAFNAVQSFALALNHSLWQRKGFDHHTRLSIVEAVGTNSLISIYVPGSKKEILDYLAVELRALNTRGFPYLLVTSGISLNESPSFRQLFLDEHASLPYSTGILSDNISTIVNTANPSVNHELSLLFGQTQEMFVFACSSTLAAAPFSQGIGNYYRNVSEHHQDRHTGAFDLFSSRGSGYSQREVQQAIVTPEELTTLGDGCLIYGSNHLVPDLIRHFTF